MTQAQGADFAILGLGIDASKADEGAARFARATEKVVQATQQVESGAVSMRRALELTFGVKIGSDIYDALKAIAKAIPENIMAATQLAARYEELGIVLGVVGGRAGYSRQEMGGFEDALKKTGISAIQSRQSLLQMLQAQLDLTSATKLARAAQDVAVVAQLNSSETLERMTLGIVSGQTRILHTMGLMVSFNAAYKEAAKTLGHELSETEKVQVRSNEVMKKAATLTGAYEASMTSASKQLRSSTRYVEDMQVGLGALFTPAYTQLVFAYADGLKAVAEWARDNKTELGDVGRVLGDMVHGAIDALKVLMQTLSQVKIMFMQVKAIADLGDTLSNPESANIVIRAATDKASGKSGTDALREADYLWERIAGNFDTIRKGTLDFDASLAKQRNILETGRYREQLGRNPLSNTGADYMRQMVGAPSLGMFGSGGQSAVGFDLFGNVPGRDRASGFTTKPDVPTPEADAATAAAKAIKSLREQLENTAAMAEAADDIAKLNIEMGKLRDRAAEVKMPRAEVDAFIQRISVARTAELDEKLVAKESADFKKKQADQFEVLGDMAEAVGARLSRLTEKWQAQDEAVKAWAKSMGMAQTEARRLTQYAEDITRNTPTFGRTNAVKMADNATEITLANQRAREQLQLQGGEKHGGADLAKLLSDQYRLFDVQRKQGEAQEALNDKTADWGAALRDVAQLAVGIASIFKDLPESIQRSVAGLGQITGGIGTLGSLKDSKNNAIGVGAALSGAGGASAALSAVSGIAAVAGGFVQLADALDLFGNKQRDEVKAMREAGRQVAETITQFREATKALGGVAESLRRAREDLAGAIPAAIQAAFGTKAGLAVGAQAADYVSQAQVDLLRQTAAQDRGRAEGLSKFGRAPALGSAAANDQLADTIQDMLQAIAERARKYAVEYIADIDRAFNAANGNDSANALLDAMGAWQQRLADASTLYSAGALSADEYAAALTKLETIYGLTVTQINTVIQKKKEQDAYDRRSFDEGTEARHLAATGNADGAAALRLAMQYEDELRAAREKGYDVTKLVIAQQEELAEAERHRLQAIAEAATSRDLSQFARETTLSNGAIAGALAQKTVDNANRARANNADTTMTDVERLRDVDLGARELAAMIAKYREQFTTSMQGLAAELTDNPVVAATITAGEQMNAGLTQYRELFLAGVISEAEFGEATDLLRQRNAKIIKAAQDAQAQAAEQFRVTALQRTADISGTVEDRRAAYQAQRTYAVEQEIAGYQKLVDAGTISQDAFDALATILRDSVAPALLDTAFAAQEAARIMTDNLNTLNQQFAVFGTNPTEQLSSIGDLYGFNGMSLADVQGQFTKATPGVELTDDQRRLNGQIADFVRAWNAAKSYEQQQMDDQTRAMAAPGGANDLVQIQASQSVSARSEGTALRLYDVQYMQLGVLRTIESNTRTAGGGVHIHIAMSAPANGAQTPQEAAQELGETLLPILLEGMGRKVGVEKRNNGDASLS